MDYIFYIVSTEGQKEADKSLQNICVKVQEATEKKKNQLEIRKYLRERKKGKMLSWQILNDADKLRILENQRKKKNILHI